MKIRSVISFIIFILTVSPLDLNARLLTKGEEVEFYKVNGKYLFKLANTGLYFKGKKVGDCDNSTSCRLVELNYDISKVTVAEVKLLKDVKLVVKLDDFEESNPSMKIADAPMKPDPKKVKIKFQGEVLQGPEDAIEYSQMFYWDIDILHKRGKRFLSSNKKFRNYLEKLVKCITKDGSKCAYIDESTKEYLILYGNVTIFNWIRNPKEFLTYNYNLGIGLGVDVT